MRSTSVSIYIVFRKSSYLLCTTVDVLDSNNNKERMINKTKSLDEIKYFNFGCMINGSDVKQNQLKWVLCHCGMAQNQIVGGVPEGL